MYIYTHITYILHVTYILYMKAKQKTKLCDLHLRLHLADSEFMYLAILSK